MYLQRPFLVQFERQLNAAVHTNSLEEGFRLYEFISAGLERCTDIQSTEAELLVDCIVKYIDYVSRCSVTTDQNAQDVERFCSIISIIPYKLPSVRDMFAQAIAITVFEKLTVVQVPFIFAKELLINFNKLVQYSDKELLYKFIADNKFWLCKLVDMLSVCGDYNHQTNILKTIFDMCPSKQITEYSNTLFPESVQLQNAFSAIGQNRFDHGVIRGLLNIINTENVNVCSIECDAVFLDDIQVVAPKSREEKVWVDFNVGSNTISTQSDSDTLKALPQHNDIISNSSDDSSEFIVVNGTDVEKVLVTDWYESEVIVSKGSLIGFDLKKPTTGSYASSWHATKVKQLKLAVLYCSQLQQLKDDFLEKMFPEKVKNLALPVIQKPKFQYTTRVVASMTQTNRSINMTTSQYQFCAPMYVAPVKHPSRLSLGIKATTQKRLNIKNLPKLMVSTHTPEVFPAKNEEFESTTEGNRKHLSDCVQGIKAIGNNELGMKHTSRMMVASGRFTREKEIMETDSNDLFEELESTTKCNSNHLSGCLQIKPVSERKLQNIMITGKYDNEIQTQENQELYKNKTVKTPKLVVNSLKVDAKKAKRTSSLPTILESPTNNLPRLKRSQKKIVCNVNPTDQSCKQIEPEINLMNLELCKNKLTVNKEVLVELQQNQMNTHVPKQPMTLSHKRVTTYDKYVQILPEEFQKQLQPQVGVKVKHQLDVAVPKRRSTLNSEQKEQADQKEVNTQESQLRMGRDRLNPPAERKECSGQLQEQVCEKIGHRLAVTESEKQLTPGRRRATKASQKETKTQGRQLQKRKGRRNLPAESEESSRQLQEQVCTKIQRELELGALKKQFNTQVEVRTEKQEKPLIIEELQDPVTIDQKQDNVSNLQQHTKVEDSRKQLQSDEFQNKVAIPLSEDEAFEKQRPANVESGTQEHEKQLINQELKKQIKINQHEQKMQHFQPQATEEGANHFQDEVFQEVAKAQKHQLHEEKCKKQLHTHELPSSLLEQEEQLVHYELEDQIKINENQQQNMDHLEQQVTEGGQTNFEVQVSQEMVESEKHQLHAEKCEKQVHTYIQPTKKRKKGFHSQEFLEPVDVDENQCNKDNFQQHTRTEECFKVKQSQDQVCQEIVEDQGHSEKGDVSKEIHQIPLSLGNNPKIATVFKIPVVILERIDIQKYLKKTQSVLDAAKREVIDKININFSAVEVIPDKIDNKNQKPKDADKLRMKVNTETEPTINNAKEPHKILKVNKSHKISLKTQESPKKLTLKQPIKTSDIRVTEQNVSNLIEHMCDNSPSTVNFSTIMTRPAGKKIIEKSDTENTAVLPEKINKKFLKDLKHITNLSPEKSSKKQSHLNVKNQKEKDKIQIEHQTDNVEEKMPKITKLDENNQKLFRKRKLTIEQPTQIITDIQVDGQNTPNLSENIRDDSSLSTKPKPCDLNTKSIISENLDKKNIKPSKVQKRFGRKLYNPNDLSYIETLDEKKINLDDSAKESIFEGNKIRRFNSTTEDCHNKSSILNEIIILEEGRKKLERSLKQTKGKCINKVSKKKLLTKNEGGIVRGDPRVKLPTPREIPKNRKSICPDFSHMSILEETEIKPDNLSKQATEKPANKEPKKQLLKANKQGNVYEDLHKNETCGEPKSKIAKDANLAFDNLFNVKKNAPVDKQPIIKSIIKNRNERLNNVSYSKFGIRNETTKNQTQIQPEVDVEFASLFEELSRRYSMHRDTPIKTKLSQSRKSTKGKSAYKSLTKSLTKNQKSNRVNGTMRQSVTHDGYESLHSDKKRHYTKTSYNRKKRNLPTRTNMSLQGHQKPLENNGAESPLKLSRSNSFTFPELEKEKTLPVAQPEGLTTDTESSEIVHPKQKVKILSNILITKGVPVKMNVLSNTCKQTEVVNLESLICSQTSTVLLPSDIYSQEQQFNTQSTENIEKIKKFINDVEQHIPELEEPNVLDNVKCASKVLPILSTMTTKKDFPLEALGELKDVLATIVRIQNTINKMLVQIVGGSIQEDFAELYELLIKFDKEHSNYFKQN